MEFFTDRQLEIMEIVWGEGSATVREAKERIEDDLAYTSVLTVFQTLEKNDAVYHKEEGKAYRYFAKVSRAEVAMAFTDWIANRSEPLAKEIRRQLEEMI